MKKTLTSQLNTEQLYRLAADTIKYCSDGEILTSNSEHIGLTFHIDDDAFFELTDEQIFLHTKGDDNENFDYRTRIKPESLEKLMYLFESMTHESNRKEQTNKAVKMTGRSAAQIIKELNLLSKATEENIVSSDSGNHIGFDVYQFLIAGHIAELAKVIGIDLEEE